MTSKIKVAVIGTGLAGLTLAHLLELNSDLIQVELFEKFDAIGMDKASITVKLDQTSFRLDSPMRSINGGSHTRLFNLYQYLKVNIVESNFSYSFFRIKPTPLTTTTPVTTSTPDTTTSTDTPLPPPYTPTPNPILTPLFIYEGSNGLKFPPLALPSTLTTWSTQIPYLFHLILITFSYIHLLFLAFFYYHLGLTSRTPTKVYWKTLVIKTFGLKNVGKMSLEKFCESHYVWKVMRDELLFPLFAAVSTVGRNEVVDLPTGEILDYIVGTFASNHYVTQKGVQQVVKSLISPLHPDRIHLNTTINSISSIVPTLSNSHSLRLHFSPTPTYYNSDSKSEEVEVGGKKKKKEEELTMDFDHIVFATQANQALTLLSTLIPTNELEKERLKALNRFEYVKTLVINHTDSSVLPPLKDRRDLNLVSYSTPSSSSSSSSSSSLSPSEEKSELGSGLLLPQTSIQATHIISFTHPHLVKNLPPSILLLQTTNPIVKIDETKILSSNWFERIKVSFGSKSVLGGFILPETASSSDNDDNDDEEEKTKKQGGEQQGGGGQYQGLKNVWFVGSWCSDGLPLLEGCVVSAEKVAGAIIHKASIEVGEGEGEAGGKGREFVVPY